MKKWDFGKVDRDRLVQWNSALRPHPMVALTGFHCTSQFYINTVGPVYAPPLGKKILVVITVVALIGS